MQKYAYIVIRDVVSRVMSFSRNIVGLNRRINIGLV